LKISPPKFVSALWLLLSEVPGWPDAPPAMRFRRALPVIAPLAAMLLLGGWTWAVRNPRIHTERAAHQPLLALEDEIAGLRVDCSDQQAADLATRSAQTARLLLDAKTELKPLLHSLKEEAAKRQWNGSFLVGEAPGNTPASDDAVIFLPARGKLTPAAGLNAGAFPSLLAVIEQFSSLEKRIDLTRLAIRADEQGRYAVELNLRLACQRTHEKTAQ